MSRLGYAAANVGERELTMGYEEFLEKTEGAAFPFVSTNIVRQGTKEPVFKPYVVVEAKRGEGKAPIRVGVLGVVRFNPLFLKSGPDKASLVIASPTEMVRRYVGEARSRSDVVVLLAAIHKDDAHLLAREVPGIDLILGSYGDKHSVEDEVEGTTRIVYTGNQGKRVGETRVYLGSESKPAAIVSYMHFLTELYPDDASMLQFTKEVTARVGQGKAEMRREEAIQEASGRHPFAGSPACKSCHESEYVQWSETAHAKAFKTLVHQKKQGDHSCLVCHVTGGFEEGGFKDAQTTPDLADVGCESCHGPGAEHSREARKGYGKVELATCVSCHNRQNSPKFDYYAYLPRVLHRAQSAR